MTGKILLGLSIASAGAALLNIPTASAQDCAYRWDTSIGMPGVPDGHVKTILAVDEGAQRVLYIGGHFTEIGGVAANNIVRYDGQTFTPLGAGVTGLIHGWVNALAMFDDGTGPALYVGGYFVRAGNEPIGYGIARWDGQEWSDVGGGLQGMSPQANALAVFDDGTGPALYIGGGMASPGAPFNDGLVRWDGHSYSTVGGGLGGDLPEVKALTVFAGPTAGDRPGGMLAVGGNFTIGPAPSAQDLALWDGSDWHAAGAGVGGIASAMVNKLTVFDDGLGSGPALCVAGSFTTAGGQPATNAARWFGGNAWEPLGDQLYNLPIAFGVFDEGAGPELYASGPATVMKWAGDMWKPIGSGWSNGARAFATFDDGEGDVMFVGGAFTTIEGRPAWRLARWACLPPLGDINEDGVVDVVDLLELFAAWGPCPPGGCPADLDFDGVVNVLDLLLLLEEWS